MLRKLASQAEGVDVLCPFIVSFSFFSMSKKLIAAMSVAFALAACNTTADVTVDNDTLDGDAMVEDGAIIDEDTSSSSASGSLTNTGAEVEMDADVDASL
jgi:hypothetical protein